MKNIWAPSPACETLALQGIQALSLGLNENCQVEVLGGGSKVKTLYKLHAFCKWMWFFCTDLHHCTLSPVCKLPIKRHVSFAGSGSLLWLLNPGAVPIEVDRDLAQQGLDFLGWPQPIYHRWKCHHNMRMDSASPGWCLESGGKTEVFVSS